MSYIFPESFTEIYQVVQKIRRFFILTIFIFVNFGVFFDIYLLQKS